MSPHLASASGLRPASAFVVVAAVVATVSGWVLALQVRRPGAQPDRSMSERGAVPDFEIVDAAGMPIALSVPTFDLEMSPRSMWQGHTPDRIAGRVSAALGGDPDPQACLELMLPDASGQGAVLVEAWELGRREALALDAWIRGEEAGHGSGEGRRGDPIPGFEIVSHQADTGSLSFRLRWRPALVLSRDVRAARGFQRPVAWTRHLADGIAQAAGILRGGRAEERRRAVWKALLPRGFHRPITDLPSERVPALRALLRAEGVHPWQMRVVARAERAYPAGEHELFGSWGYPDPEQPAPSPRDGLELLSARTLADDAFSFLERRPAEYRWLADRAVLGQRADAFVGYVPASPAPVVATTLDLGLQGFVQAALRRALEEHKPALAMAIVVDVQSAAVLAVDSVEAYPVGPFAPVFHAFTPGSTLKVLTMSTALEAGAVQPETRFEVGNGEYRLVDPADGRVRVIHEAEGSRTGTISAEECLAFSVNAGMAQIGVRVPAPVFRGKLVELGYGRPPGAGLGVERPGYLPPLPWKYRFTHASVSFGHELSTTLWQHAAGLASVARGGEHRPLRMLDAVRAGEARYPVEAPEPRRVFAPDTCRKVLGMMRRAATEGRRKDLWREEVWVATKTGTAQKVPTEVCLHVELAERTRCEERGIPFSPERYAALRSRAKPHKSCYTSSMCAVGRFAGRELLVLVVLDEPRGKMRFGSDVAGPTAAAILWEALGITRRGSEPIPDAVPGFGPSALDERNERERPWEVAWR